VWYFVATRFVSARIGFTQAAVLPSTSFAVSPLALSSLDRVCWKGVLIDGAAGNQTRVALAFFRISARVFTSNVSQPPSLPNWHCVFEQARLVVAALVVRKKSRRFTGPTLRLKSLVLSN